MKTLVMMVAVLTIGGCVDVREELPGPKVWFFTDASEAPPWNEEDKAYLQAGADQWRRLCFDVQLIGEKPTEEYMETATYVEDYYYFRVRRDGTLKPWGRTEAWHGLIRINPEPDKWNLTVVMSHEFGHMFTRFEEHLPGRTGVMYGTAWGQWELTEDDFAWACSYGLCDRCDD